MKADHEAEGKALNIDPETAARAEWKQIEWEIEQARTEEKYRNRHADVIEQIVGKNKPAVCRKLIQKPGTCRVRAGRLSRKYPEPIRNTKRRNCR